MPDRSTLATPTTRLGVGVALALALTLLALAPAGASAAAPDTLWDACPTGSGAGECILPGGVVTDEATGDVFVADLTNRRIDEFSIWGVFVKAWGWGVRSGASELQTCTTQTGCREGLEGGGDGQLDGLLGVAVDSEGDVYVTGWNTARVQKFDPDGGPGGEAEFLLTFGGEVNKTKSEEPGSNEAERNLCTAASGDVCQAGVRGSGKGQFEVWPEVGNFIALAPDDDIYVGDEDRIQRFDSEGHYIESIALPGERVESLAIDRSGGVNDGDLYVVLCNLVSFCANHSTIAATKPNVLRLAPSGPTASVEATIAVPAPRALAVDADGNVYVTDGAQIG
ncbi:MAG TPA: NHL repeat-containing protein, partial [Solirubrobacterales bacterium]|nr:NHL repeat-containing protein [Solirubrobacterales bacterium]